MKRIDFESHFVTKEYVKAMLENNGYPRYFEDENTGKRRLHYTADVGEPLGDLLLNNLLNLGEERLRAMDEAKIDLQVLSLTTPGVEQFEVSKGTVLAKKMNDELSDVISKYPNKFIGYAALAPKNPETAVEELERAVKELGFKGWKTHSNYGDGFIDEKKYWPILEMAEKLDVPIYLHPTVPIIPQMNKYGWALSGAPFGFGIQAALYMMRLIYSGIFDKYEKLKIILGHLGEGLPFILTRIDFVYVKPWFDPDVRPAIKKKPSEYLKKNVFVTTSGNCFEPAFRCTYKAMGVERILLATDYPYEDSNECIKFLEELSIPEKEKEKIYYLNAKQVGITL